MALLSEIIVDTCVAENIENDEYDDGKDEKQCTVKEHYKIKR